MKHKSYQGKYTAPRPRRAPVWLWVVPVIVLLVSITAAAFILIQRANAREEYSRLAAAVHESQAPATQATTLPETQSTSVPTQETSPEPTVTETTEPETTEAAPTESPYQPLAEYERLYEQNPDFYGWIQIADTAVDYPVMHTPKDPEKYLHKGFSGSYSEAGVPFMDYRCAQTSDNLIIYGHNMSDGSMFHSIMDYQDITYWQRHPVIRFDTLSEAREFEILAVFFDRVYYTHETCFKFYNFIDAGSEEAFQEAVATLKDKSIYDTGVTPVYGQQLITLVTCAYHVENGRFVVVACEKSPEGIE